MSQETEGSLCEPIYTVTPEMVYGQKWQDIQQKITVAGWKVVAFRPPKPGDCVPGFNRGFPNGVQIRTIPLSAPPDCPQLIVEQVLSVTELVERFKATLTPNDVYSGDKLQQIANALYTPDHELYGWEIKEFRIPTIGDRFINQFGARDLWVYGTFVAGPRFIITKPTP
jgi:hypothetical protein